MGAENHIPSSDDRRLRARMPDDMPDAVDVHVGKRLRLIRQVRNYSLPQVAQAIGVSYQQLQKYELGANRVSASRLYDLAKVLDVPESFFFDDMPDELVRERSALVASDALLDISPVDPALRAEVAEFVAAIQSIADPRSRAALRKLIRELAPDAE